MLNPDFREFIKSLNDSGVRYLIVGGYAVAFHGHPRYTKDLDVWVEATPDGVDFETCHAARIQVVLDEVPVNFIDVANLKRNKQAAGRLQDLADLENIR